MYSRIWPQMYSYMRAVGLHILVVVVAMRYSVLHCNHNNYTCTCLAARGYLLELACTCVPARSSTQAFGAYVHSVCNQSSLGNSEAGLNSRDKTGLTKEPMRF